ncbi:hypothetical protein ACFX15_031330 [Malus domestica]
MESTAHHQSKATSNELYVVARAKQKTCQWIGRRLIWWRRCTTSSSEWRRRAPVWNRKNEDDAEDVVDRELLNLQQTTSCQHSTHLTSPGPLPFRRSVTHLWTWVSVLGWFDFWQPSNLRW